MRCDNNLFLGKGYLVELKKTVLPHFAEDITHRLPLKNGAFVKSALNTFDSMLVVTPFIMANEQNQMVQPEDWRINVNDAWQVLWWCRSLGITKTQLEKAISTVGNVIIDIKHHLGRPN